MARQIRGDYFGESLPVDSTVEVLPPTIVIIETRAFIRDCLALCLREKLGHPVLTFPDIDNWEQARQTVPVGAILLGNIDAKESFVLSDLFADDLEVPVIVFSNKTSPNNVANILRSGAKGYIPSDTPLEIVARAIKLVLVGGVFIPADAALEMWQSNPPEFARAERGPNFTARENEVVKALLKGMSNKVIAHELGLSASSVKVHVSNVMRKLKVHSRTEAVLKLAEIMS